MWEENGATAHARHAGKRGRGSGRGESALGPDWVSVVALVYWLVAWGLGLLGAAD